MLDLQALARQVRVDPEDGEALMEIQRLAEAALLRVSGWLERVIYDPASPPVPVPAGAIPLTADIAVAIGVLVGAAYDSRDGSGDAALGMPPAAHDLLIGYRRFESTAP